MIDGTKLPYTDTEVSIERSKERINLLLKKFGARGIQWTWLNNTETLRFLHEYDYKGVKHDIVYEISIPEIGVKRGRSYNQKLVRNDQQAYRIVLHIIKAKLTAVETGVETFENEFLSKILYQLSDGTVQKVGDVILQQISQTKKVNLLRG